MARKNKLDEVMTTTQTSTAKYIVRSIVWGRVRDHEVIGYDAARKLYNTLVMAIPDGSHYSIEIIES